jgi:cell division protein FtsW
MKFSYLAYAVSILLMIAVLIPGIGVAKKGATRWLGVGSFTFQPSEIMKITLVFAVATFISLNYKKLAKLSTYVPVGIMLLIVCIIMYMQDHLSGTLVMIVGTLSIVFASGIKLKTKLIILTLILLIGRSILFYNIRTI